jgi:hypothetical protein
MLALPPVAPAVGWCASLRPPRDHYVRLDSNDYSVHPGAVGRRVLVRADLERVQAFCDGEQIGRAQTHLGHPPNPVRPNPYRGGEGVAPQTHQRGTADPEPEVAIRSLDDYDAALGIDLDGGVA